MRKDQKVNGSVKGKRFLFVTYRFYPISDAVSIVVHNIAKELIRRGAIASVLYITHQRVEEKEHDGIVLEPIYIPELKNLKTLLQEVKSHPFETLSLAFQKAIGQVINLLSKYKKLSVEYMHVKKYRKKIKSKYANNQYDYYIATLSPTEAQMAFTQLKKTGIEFAMYQLDTFWNNATLSTRYQLDRLEFEKKLVKECLFNLTTEQIIETTGTYHGEYSKKLIKSEFPMVIRPAQKVYVHKDDIIKCVYTGTLYHSIRPPHNIIKIISELTDKDLSFDFYGFHQDLIEKDVLYSKAKNHIKLFGVVKPEEANEARLAADFLINIDNTCPEQVPSKIFEYISTGKPIINFYYNKNSAILEYLKKYPLCVNIYIGEGFELVSACDNLIKFIKNAYRKLLPFDEIEKNYKENIPSYVTEQIIKAFENC